MNEHIGSAAIEFQRLEAMDAPSEDSWWMGLLSGIGAVGIGVAVLT